MEEFFTSNQLAR